MQRSRAEYLIDQLLSHQLSKAELDELLVEVGKGDALADYSDVLEQYFNYLVEQAELEGQQEAPEEREFDFSLVKVEARPTTIKKLYSNYGRMAAIIALITSIAAVLYLAPWRQAHPSGLIRSETQLATGFDQEAVVFRGKRQSLRLTDGTYIRLNSDSRLNYPAVFQGKGRSVSMTGEAYFDVAKDKARPFSILLDDLKVVVLGTAFNVKAYDDEEEVTVTVRSGRVSVTLYGNDTTTIVITRNEKLTFNRKTEKYNLSNVDAMLDCSWVEGFMQFNHTPLRTVEQTLERWYSVNIIIKDKALYETSFTGKHLNENLISALESICFAINASYKIKGQTVTIYK